MSCTLLMIRHAVTSWNREGRYQGHADPALSSAGHSQARRLVRCLQGLQLDAIYSSDLRRAIETAAPLASHRGLTVHQDPRLRELNFGTWDGRLAEAVIAADPAGWSAWWADPVTLAPPGGETVSALWERLRQAVQEISLRHPGGTVAVVTHGGPLRLVLARVTSGRLHPPPQVSVPNGGWLLLTPEARQTMLADG